MKSYFRIVHIIYALIIASTPLCGADVQADVDPLTQQDQVPVTTRWSWFGDALARYDHVDGLPNGRADLSRIRGRLRAGFNFSVTPELNFASLIKLAAGSDSNSDNRRNNDNERSDTVTLDQLFLRWHPREGTEFAIGKRALPLELSPLVWDMDLRPAGFAASTTIALGDFDQLSLAGGYFADQHLYGDDSKLAAAQAAWRIHAGAPTHGALLLSFLHFIDLDQLVLQGLGRTNTLAGGHYVNAYRLLDLQSIIATDMNGWPLEFRLDMVRNLGADKARDGSRASVTVGNARKQGKTEFGFADQRIQKDAVLAAFNSDDWWFHSATRGVMLWAGYGLEDDRWLRLAYFRERRDGLSEYTQRVLLDFNARF